MQPLLRNDDQHFFEIMSRSAGVSPANARASCSSFNWLLIFPFKLSPSLPRSSLNVFTMDLNWSISAWSQWPLDTESPFDMLESVLWVSNKLTISLNFLNANPAALKISATLDTVVTALTSEKGTKSGYSFHSPIKLPFLFVLEAGAVELLAAEVLGRPPSPPPSILTDMIIGIVLGEVLSTLLWQNSIWRQKGPKSCTNKTCVSSCNNKYGPDYFDMVMLDDLYLVSVGVNSHTNLRNETTCQTRFVQCLRNRGENNWRNRISPVLGRGSSTKQSNGVCA